MGVSAAIGAQRTGLSYFIGVLCSSASPAPTPCDNDGGSPTIPSGQLKLRLTEVVTTGDTVPFGTLTKI